MSWFSPWKVVNVWWFIFFTLSSSTTFSLSVALIQTSLFWHCLIPNMNAAEVPSVCSQSLVYVLKLSHDGVAGCSFVWANILDKMIFPPQTQNGSPERRQKVKMREKNEKDTLQFSKWRRQNLCGGSAKFISFLLFFSSVVCPTDHTLCDLRENNVQYPLFFLEIFQIGKQPFGMLGTFWSFYIDVRLVLVQERNSLYFLCNHRNYTPFQENLSL